jgi:hypothetical protein
MNMVDIRKMTSLSDDARQALTAAFDAMAKWRDEISATNDRCLPKLVDQMTEVQRAMGWPPQWSAAGREQLLKASKMQTQMIDQIMDTWEQTLKSPGALQGAAMLPMPGSSVSGSNDPMKDMMQFWELFPPFRFWMQAAEAYQRQLTNMDPGSTERKPPHRRVA